MKKRLYITFLLVFAVVSAAVATGQWKGLETLKEQTLSFFRPLSGKIVSFTEDRCVIDLGSRDGVKKGMRLEVLRGGVPLKHPVTGELIGQTQTTVAEVEIISVNENSSECRPLNGLPRRGDIVKTGHDRVKVLFYQDENIDYYLADAYYRELKKSGRLILIDAPIEPFNRQQLLSMAKERAADVILWLSGRTDKKGILLRQSLMWSDGRQIHTTEILVPRHIVAEYKKQAGPVAVSTTEPLLSFTMPHDLQQMLLVDLQGDGSRELVLSTATELYFYKYDIELSFISSFKGRKTEEIIWLDAADLNNDNKKELIVTTISDTSDEVTSYVYGIISSAGINLRELWRTRGFLRVHNNTLLYQAFSPYEGFTGPIREVVYKNGGFRIKDLNTSLPPLFNIYDFTEIKDREGNEYFIYIDDENYLNLLNPEGVLLWRSEESLGGPRWVFDKEPLMASEVNEKWYIKDRMISTTTEVFVVKKEPLVEQAKTLGYKKSQVLLVWVNAGAIHSSVIVENISGELLDISLAGSRIITLSKPLLGFKAENILKGKNPFVTYINVYSMTTGG